MIVPVKDQIDLVRIHDLPEPPHCRITASPRRAEKRHVEIRESTQFVAGRELLMKPCLLKRSLRRGAVDCQLAVQNEHLPLAVIVAVVAFARFTRACSEVSIVRRTAVGQVIVIAD